MSGMSWWKCVVPLTGFEPLTSSLNPKALKSDATKLERVETADSCGTRRYPISLVLIQV